MRGKKTASRLYFVWFLFLWLGLASIWRLFDLQILRHKVYLALAKEQHDFLREIKPRRGAILTRDGYPLVINKDEPSVYAVPKEIASPPETAKLISSLLGLDFERVAERLAKPDDPYEPLARQVSEAQAKKLSDLKIKGIYVGRQLNRFYPEGAFASQLLGFVDANEQGQYGIEGFNNRVLEGEPGFLSGERDALGNWVGKGLFALAKDGPDLTLTIDHLIQFKAEQELERIVKLYQAKGGSIVIMEPKTGAIRAMTSRPNFDPNNYSEVEDISYFLNPVIHSQFEPGSVAKVMTMAAALDDGRIRPETTYEDKGSVTIAGYEIKNFDSKIYGRQTMSEALEKSLNLGAIFAAQKMNKSTFLNYLKDFGWGEKTGISLPGERSGDISNLRYNLDINYATAAFGQGISLTPLQLITAVGAIANNGYLVTPRIFEREPVRLRRQVVSEKTAREVKAMMASALEKSYRQARVDGFQLAAKTGTAQVAGKGGYLEEKSIHSFIGFGPLDEPRFIILLKLDEPVGVRFSGSSLSPAFKNLAQFLLGFYKIAPSQAN